MLVEGEWVPKSLSDLIDIRHGFAFKGAFIREEECGDILLTPGNFAIGGGFKDNKFKYYDSSIPEEFILSSGDLLVTMTDLSKQADTLGYPAVVPKCPEGRRYLHNQRLGKVVIKDNLSLNARYLYYVMCSAEYRQEVLASATGTTVKHTSPERIKRFRFLLPPIPKQRAIAHILGTLDDKIELNRRMNETLEEMARALFKSWFVDFDPVRAKMEGRDTGLPKHLADLFPDRLVESELCEIPEGWEVGTVSQLTERIQNGGTPKRSKATYWERGEIPWLTSGEIRQSFVLETQNFISEEGLAKSSAKMVPARSILVALYGATAGQVSMNYRPLSTNQAVSAVIPSTGNRYFCLISLKLKVSDFKNRAVGSAQQNISKKVVEDTIVLLPQIKLRSVYDALMEPLFDRIFHNLDENKTLAAIRDTLLPKLISGEMGVNTRDEKGEAVGNHQ